MVRRQLQPLLVFVFLQMASIDAWGGQSEPGCRWSGPPAKWALALHPPAGEVSGSLGSDIIPLLQRNGIPVSVITREADMVLRSLSKGPIVAWTMKSALGKPWR